MLLETVMNNNIEKSNIQDASVIVQNAYIEYASYVNSYRSIPSAVDGLKVVQRRVLATLLRNPVDKYVATMSIVGDCLKYYHPHGSSAVEGTIANMINEEVPLLEGKGNFGYRGLISTEPAAARYTKIKLNENLKQLKSLSPFAAYATNENGYNEPVNLPLILPACLLNGSIGLGVGASTNIPMCTPSSLKKVARQYLTSSSDRNFNITPSCNGILDITPKELKRFNTTGICKCIERAEISKTRSSRKTEFIITRIPHSINPTIIFTKLKNELDDNMIYIRDESSDNMKIIIGRCPNVRKLSDNDLFDMISKILSRKVTYRCVVSHKGKAQLMSPHEILRLSLDYSILCYTQYLESCLSTLLNKVLFEEIKHLLADMLINRKSREDIIQELRLTSDQYTLFTAKPISTLRSDKKDISQLEGEIDTLRSSLDNTRESFLKFINF